MEANKIIEMRGIYKKFGNVNALNGVDLHLNEGEVLGLVGDNAAGKSTLCKILSGALKPTLGDIFVNEVKQNLDDIKIFGVFDPAENDFSLDI